MQTLIVIIIVSLCVFYIGRRFYKNLKGEPSSCGCGDGCGDCASRSPDCDPNENPDCGLNKNPDCGVNKNMDR